MLLGLKRADSQGFLVRLDQNAAQKSYKSSESNKEKRQVYEAARRQDT